MTFVDALLVALGAAVGAPTRYAVEQHVAPRLVWMHDGFPWGTWIVNMVGSFILGWASAALAAPQLLLVGVGFCGSLTTFSGFANETVQMGRARRWALSAVYIVLSFAGCIAVAAFGHHLAG